MKKFFKDFKRLDLSWKIIFVGTFIAAVGYVMAPEGETPHELWDPVMWIGSGIALFGWLWGAFRG